jgi:hypothetical protein
MAVLKRCAEELGDMERVEISSTGRFWGVRPCHMGWDFDYADTLELAICQFAKKLFEKGTP